MAIGDANEVVKLRKELAGLRDTFAAAALTGIIAASDDSEIKQPQAEFLARQAWLVADAVLRERARNGAPVGRETVTDHDAASAAKAAELARSPGQSPRGTGDTTWEPLCWCCSGPGIQSFHESKADAEEYREHSGIADEVEVFQVGRAFALTDAEREAVEWCVEMAVLHATECDEEIAALRGLLARLGGDA